MLPFLMAETLENKLKYKPTAFARVEISHHFEAPIEYGHYSKV